MPTPTPIADVVLTRLAILHAARCAAETGPAILATGDRWRDAVTIIALQTGVPYDAVSRAAIAHAAATGRDAAWYRGVVYLTGTPA